MTPEQIVREFFEEVRSGHNPDYATILMAEQVLAHQVISEEELTVLRTPKDYAEHVKEMIEAYGNFSLEIQEFLVQGNKVYVRWKQEGTHVREVDGYQPTGLPVIEIASAIYRIEDEKISEYWIQIDRSGIQKQLERNKHIK
ncbi:ester cyclase [Neobacillus pocheonensis]|uniref:Ester cyclase n=1 Tax=Neobacillus pocheonensis TaxID=363869 RepID=A0ABT0WEM6_9BACI|nr:ester cyclase [Neobacillus pocheonensis]